MGEQNKHWMNETDIGSGEKSAGQKDVERDEASLSAGESDAARGRILQSGSHLARIVAVRQPDGLFEAQVYVRLAREPALAETYIPAGMYPTEAEAWAAAEERARRAFDEREF